MRNTWSKESLRKGIHSSSESLGVTLGLVFGYVAREGAFMGIFSKKKQQGVPTTKVEEVWPFGLESGFVVLDLETTGLNPIGDRIIEIGLIRTDPSGKPLGYWNTFINPKQPVTATEIHGIRDSDVSSSPSFEDCAPDILSRIKGQALVAHNANFDISFLRTELARAGWEMPNVPVVCTMNESKSFIPGLSRTRLADCISAIGITQEVEHRAIGDAAHAAALFYFYLNGPTNPERATQIKEYASIASRETWPADKTFPPIGKQVSKRDFVKTAPTRSELLKEVSEIMPEDLLTESASSEEISYCSLLLDALDDGVISEEEIFALSQCATSFGLHQDSVNQIHKVLLVSLAREAWRDGVVSRAEKQEIIESAIRLGLTEKDAQTAIKDIEDVQAARISARSKVLPEFWAHGEPLRVGDRVVITGCYEQGRDELETKSRKLGVKIIGSVSGKTTLLVSDGTINGNKESDAVRLNIRIVTPVVYRELLEFIQPGMAPVSETKKSQGEGEEKTENLVCVKCAQTFTRVASKGRKPHLCPSCKSDS